MTAPPDPDTLQNGERIYLARRLREAQAVEEFLTRAGVDYVVEVEAYSRSFLFGSVRHGAAFYVEAEYASDCRRRLVEGGFTRGLVDDPAAGE